MAQYRILTNQDRDYLLATPTPVVVRELRRLQVTSTYYTDARRYEIITEMLWEDEYVERIEEREGKQVAVLKKPTIDSLTFRERAAALLFPSAPVAENADAIDYEALGGALEDFLSRFESPSQRLSAFFT